MTDDPEIIMSRHNGRFSRGGISVEVCICRLDRTKWSLEIVDNDNNSVVWDGEFETDDEAFEEDGARDVVGILRGAVSGKLMVLDQAARSIG
jgi:hypothetical protein